MLKSATTTNISAPSDAFSMALLEFTFMESLRNARASITPFRHWLLYDSLPATVAQGITTLPWSAPLIDATPGTREANNATRTYFNGVNRGRYGICDQVASFFQSRETVSAIERTCGTDLTGTSLRIEYCQDCAGFWLNPHTDIGVKKLTMQIYLSQGPGSDTWGTDLLDSDGNPVVRVPGTFTAGMIFVPSSDTWHGFTPRPIYGVRKSILINYVGPEWRDRDQLSFPDTPIPPP
jgi:hypothetical protein